MKLLIKNIPVAVYKKWLALCVGILKKSGTARRLLSFEGGFVNAIIDGSKNMIAMMRGTVYTTYTCNRGEFRSPWLGYSYGKDPVAVLPVRCVPDDDELHERWLQNPNPEIARLTAKPSDWTVSTNAVPVVLYMDGNRPRLEVHISPNTWDLQSILYNRFGAVFIRTRDKGVFKVGIARAGRPVVTTVRSDFKTPASSPDYEGYYPAQDATGIIESDYVDGTMQIRKAYIYFLEEGELVEAASYQVDGPIGGQYTVELRHPKLVSRYYPFPEMTVLVSVPATPDPNAVLPAVSQKTQNGVKVEAQAVGSEVGTVVDQGNVTTNAKTYIQYRSASHLNEYVKYTVVRPSSLSIETELSAERDAVIVRIKNLPARFGAFEQFRTPVETRIEGGQTVFYSKPVFQELFHLSAGRVAVIKADGEVRMDSLTIERIYVRVLPDSNGFIPLTEVWLSIEEDVTTLYSSADDYAAGAVEALAVVNGVSTPGYYYREYHTKNAGVYAWTGNIRYGTAGVVGMVQYRYEMRTSHESVSGEDGTFLTVHEYPAPEFESHTYRPEVVVKYVDGVPEADIVLTPVEVQLATHTVVHRPDSYGGVIVSTDSDNISLPVVAENTASYGTTHVTTATIEWRDLVVDSNGEYLRSQLQYRIHDFVHEPMCGVATEKGVFECSSTITRKVGMKEPGASVLVSYQSALLFAEGFVVSYGTRNGPVSTALNTHIYYAIIPKELRLPGVAYSTSMVESRVVMEVHSDGSISLDWYEALSSADAISSVGGYNTLYRCFWPMVGVLKKDKGLFDTYLAYVDTYLTPRPSPYTQLGAMAQSLRLKYQDIASDDMDWEEAKQDALELERAAEAVFDSVSARHSVSNVDMKRACMMMGPAGVGRYCPSVLEYL